MTASLGALVLAGCTAGSTAGAGGASLPGMAAAAVRLVSFDSCDQALTELKTAAEPHVSPYGVQPGWAAFDMMVDRPVEEALAEGDASVGMDAGAGMDAEAGDAGDAGAPAPLAMDDAAGAERASTAGSGDGEYSGTNVHEDGVDEPDLVKTDGRRLITIQGETLRVVDLERQELTGTLELPGASEQLLLSGDRLLVVTYAWAQPFLDDRDLAATTMPAWDGVELVLVDVSGEPRVIERLTVDGSYTDARLVGDTARLVLRSSPRLPSVYPDRGRSEDAAREANLEALHASTIDDWLPQYVHRVGDSERTGRLVDCADVSHPAEYSGSAMLNVVTVDLAAGLDPVGTVSVLGDGHTVYATGESLYVADGGQWRFGGADEVTQFHKFDISGSGQPSYRGSGAVEGWLINQYAMSEHDGYLRVATTTEDFRRPMRMDDEPASESQVVVLAERDGELEVVGRVGGLGKGERIYAVRFMGPIGYVVTFREIDPLYTIDLSDPIAPALRGELKIPGYSAYLHPVGEGRLVGVGQDATEEGRQLGTQVSLFDVADLDDPQRIATFGVDSATSEVEYDPHAFLYWPRDELLVLPLRTAFWAEPLPLPRPDGSAEGAEESADIAPWMPPAGGALVLRLDGDRFTEVGTIEHPTSQVDQRQPYDWVDASVRRSLVVGETLWTVSAAGAMGHHTGTLDEQAWIPFD
jgi:Beta propeller domain